MDDICIGGNDMLLKGAKCNIFIMRISGVVPLLVFIPSFWSLNNCSKIKRKMRHWTLQDFYEDTCV